MKLVTSPAILKHEVEPACPEKASRLDALMAAVPEITDALKKRIPSQQVTVVERNVDGNFVDYLTSFHTLAYIRRIKEHCAQLREPTNISDHPQDVSFSSSTYDAACHAVGVSVRAARYALEGETSFALVRPPGHHAFADKESGFCIFNNVAIAAENLRRQREKVMIIDIDLHLGDGTLSYVKDKKETFYFSINQSDTWPFVVPADTENSRNIFLPAGTMDKIYISTLREGLEKALNQFKPSIVAVSAGFDTCHYDQENCSQELDGGMNLTHRSYDALWDLLNARNLPYFAVLEGGYHPDSVRTGVMSFIHKNGS